MYVLSSPRTIRLFYICVPESCTHVYLQLFNMFDFYFMFSMKAFKFLN